MKRLCTVTRQHCRRGRICRQRQYKTAWITFRGHSRSHILGSLKSRRGTAYYCIIMWTLESQISHERSEHLRVREPQCHSAPCLGNPCKYSHKPYIYFWKLESLVYILPLIVWIYLPSHFSDRLCQTIFSARVCFGRSRSCKVIDFGTNRKRAYATSY